MWTVPAGVLLNETKQKISTWNVNGLYRCAKNKQQQQQKTKTAKETNQQTQKQNKYDYKNNTILKLHHLAISLRIK